MSYHTIYKESCQDAPVLLEPLSDVGRNGRERPWRSYKLANELLSEAYKGFNDAKSDRLQACSRVLTFKVDSEGRKDLFSADSCRVRLCPLCSWRRSLKNYHNTRKIIEWLQAHRELDKVGSFDFIFVTLTVKNCGGSELSSTLDALFAAVKRLYQRQEIKGVWLGAVRNLEITHNVCLTSKDYDTYHPHFHMLVAVRPPYFKRGYITQARLSELWREALRVEYTPVVDIRRVKAVEGQSLAGAIAECSKYASKPGDYILPEDWDLTQATVRVLDPSLSGRRLINYSGIFREVKALLKLEDPEDGNLVNVGDDGVTEGETKLVSYYWYSGYRQYYRV